MMTYHCGCQDTDAELVMLVTHHGRRAPSEVHIHVIDKAMDGSVLAQLCDGNNVPLKHTHDLRNESL